MFMWEITVRRDGTGPRAATGTIVNWVAAVNALEAISRYSRRKYNQFYVEDIVSVIKTKHRVSHVGQALPSVSVNE